MFWWDILSLEERITRDEEFISIYSDPAFAILDSDNNCLLVVVVEVRLVVAYAALSEGTLSEGTTHRRYRCIVVITHIITSDVLIWPLFLRA